MKRSPSIEDLAEGVRCGDRARLGRAITLVESNRRDHRRQAQALLGLLLPDTGRAHRLGVSGVPGAGKSTLIECLGSNLIDAGRRVAVLAVDPSSQVSRGSILGDKTRMARLSNEPNAFIRPSPSGGTLGGVTRKTRETVLLCEAAGFDVVIVETVGVGQSEAAVAQMVDVFLLVLIAGAGDELQGIKRGILELVDAIAINKADGDNRERAEATRLETARALRLLRGREGDAPPVVTTSAKENRGVEALWTTLAELREGRVASGALDRTRERQRVGWMWALVEEELVSSFRANAAVRSRIEAAEARVASGKLSPTLAAEELLEAFGIDL